MINPAIAMKLMAAKNAFTNNHPKFVSFLTTVFGSGIPKDTIVEITVTKPGHTPITSNIKIKEEDLELMNTFKDMMGAR